jgi:hypothetical protein
LKEAEREDFLRCLPTEFRLCYIEDSDLSATAATNGISLSECLEKYVLPDVGNIKSGDFGEILSYFVVIENAEKSGFNLVGPKKWQWKERNKAAPYSDCILFYLPNVRNFSDDDLALTVESKMKATKSKEHRIQLAVNGACDDRLSRMAKTLNWLVEKYARLGDMEQKAVAERFKDPATFGPYKKKYKAIALLDSTFENGELDLPVENLDGISVIVFSLKDLKDIYENTRTSVIGSV